ncbi:MAG: GTPase [Gemmatimonadota bacterium]|nr:MAG: GTPase [Gemmatimonadota bacterium]
MSRRRVVIMGAAGRDFHNFNVLFREAQGYEVVAFTAAQIPDIEDRTYPPSLAGPLYPQGIPIEPEEELEAIVKDRAVDEVWFAYSDVSHEYVMHRGSRVVGWGPSFGICSAVRTMLRSTRPVIAVTAVRTGAGKSQTTRFLARILKDMGRKAVVVRHPMPYGDLAAQACQRFATYEDLDRHQCTIEEREEYQPHIDNGFVVFAGIDYAEILREAEKEADVILWDGGNNDTPFFRPDLYLTVVDPHRPGHELSYYPGETNFLLADLIVVNKVQTADPEDVEEVLANARRHNPAAHAVLCRSAIRVEGAERLKGRRVLVVEDGPTLTHGGMSRGAGWYAAREAGAAEIVDPRPYAVGSIAATYEAYPNAAGILPAMGYGDEQIRELESTIEAAPAEVVVEGTPIDLSRVLTTKKPIVRVRYELEELEAGEIRREVERVLSDRG